MRTVLRKIKLEDAEMLLAIMNYYALDSTTAYFSDEPADHIFIRNIIHNDKDLPKYLVECNNQIVGFGYAYPFRPEKSFARTVKFTYWFNPKFTGRGFGKRLYDLLENECRGKGIQNILVNISSDNSGSIKFHEREGFVHCGRFKGIANKSGKEFDLVWMQKNIS